MPCGTRHQDRATGNAELSERHCTVFVRLLTPQNSIWFGVRCRATAAFPTSPDVLRYAAVFVLPQVTKPGQKHAERTRRSLLSATIFRYLTATPRGA